MPESNMSISVNGQSQVPPGFRFHPTEEELLQYYLKKKVSNQRIDLDVIRDVDLNKLEPWDIQEKCRIGTTPQNDWYFFSHKDKKYPTGTRTNRATAAGFWKATGRDKVIYSNCKRIGMRKTLVFYKGRAPHGQKSDWIMHEYRLDDNTTIDSNISTAVMVETAQEEGWVVCRIFKKKNHHKTLDSPVMSSVTVSTDTRSCNNQLMMFDSDQMNEEGALEEIFQYPGRIGGGNCKEDVESNNNNRLNTRIIPSCFNSSTGINMNMNSTGTVNNDYNNGRFLKLPSLDSPNSTSSQNCYQPSLQGSDPNNFGLSQHDQDHDRQTEMITNWATLDRLVASQLNGLSTDQASRQFLCFTSTITTNTQPIMDYCTSNNHDDHHDNNDDHLQMSAALRSSSSSSNKPNYHATQDYSNEMELWSTFARSSSSLLSSSDPICHVANAQL